MLLQSLVRYRVARLQFRIPGNILEVGTGMPASHQQLTSLQVFTGWGGPRICKNSMRKWVVGIPRAPLMSWCLFTWSDVICWCGAGTPPYLLQFSPGRLAETSFTTDMYEQETWQPQTKSHSSPNRWEKGLGNKYWLASQDLCTLPSTTHNYLQ